MQDTFCEGEIEDNCEVRPHRAISSTATDYRLHRHHGNNNINDLSAPFNQNQYESLKTEAGESYAAFNTEMSGILGGWWNSKPTDYKETIHAIFEKL